MHPILSPFFSSFFCPLHFGSLSIFPAAVPLLTSSHHFVVSRCLIRDLGLRCILQCMETPVYALHVSHCGCTLVLLRLAAWPRHALAELWRPQGALG